jgi:hypothetical protein
MMTYTFLIFYETWISFTLSRRWWHIHSWSSMKPEYRLHTPKDDDIHIPDLLWNLNIVCTFQKMRLLNTTMDQQCTFANSIYRDQFSTFFHSTLNSNSRVVDFVDHVFRFLLVLHFLISPICTVTAFHFFLFQFIVAITFFDSKIHEAPLCKTFFIFH